MIQIITDLLKSDSIGKVMVLLMTINAVLSGAAVVLQKLVDMGEVKKDSAIAQIIAKVSSVLVTIIDFVSANRAH